MLTLALVAAAVAAVLHVGIFLVESVLFDSAHPRFGVAGDDLHAVRPWAFNQGFYNLFLAVVAGVGVVVALRGGETAGLALVLAACGSMLAAAVVLLSSQPRLARSAAGQGLPALVAVVPAAALLLGAG
ncbi:DUF1304 family protein [Cellulomonas endophytica]|uniref:DUF1304 family protein n=1 Tax=Cellulomonas endophytica TaxID=2494735 RepID=UPI00196B42F5|nr:DUF1304 family protein [Cellulomonas endophytica]